MKKFLKVLAVLVVLVFLVFYFFGIPYFVGMITTYDRYTFEYVTENPEVLESFAIGDNRDPGDYGFTYQEVDYKSVWDDIDLNGWYVPSSKEGVTQTLMINHGRTSNRLKTVKYLELVKDYGLDSLYNVFIPDLRNSGKSQESKTALGYEFAEDIVSSMKMLKDNHGQNEFILWGFSMGAMASAVSVNRPDLVEYQEAEGLKVKKLILASPLSNVYETSWVAAQDMGIPAFIFNMAWSSFDSKVDDWSENMKFSYLLSNNKLPALVLYGNGDATTPAEILETEIEGQMNVYPVLFQGADHVRIYTRDDYRQRYGDRVDQFVRMAD